MFGGNIFILFSLRGIRRVCTRLVNRGTKLGKSQQGTGRAQRQNEAERRCPIDEGAFGRTACGGAFSLMRVLQMGAGSGVMRMCKAEAQCLLHSVRSVMVTLSLRRSSSVGDKFITMRAPVANATEPGAA